jgi:hypothetical protein
LGSLGLRGTDSPEPARAGSIAALEQIRPMLGPLWARVLLTAKSLSKPTPRVNMQIVFIHLPGCLWCFGTRV